METVQKGSLETSKNGQEKLFNILVKKYSKESLYNCNKEKEILLNVNTISL
jgi:hypothetical protein